MKIVLQVLKPGEITVRSLFQCLVGLTQIFHPSKLSVRALLGLGRGPWPLEEWLAQHREAAIDPEMEIIDPHHHLWDPQTQPRGLPMPIPFVRLFYLHRPAFVVQACLGMRAAAQDPSVSCFRNRQVIFDMPYMGEELRRDIRNEGAGAPGHKVVNTVFLEAGWAGTEPDEAMRPVGEARMAQGVHEASPGLCGGIVPHANLLLPDVERTLQAYSEMPLVKGVRHSLAVVGDAAISGNATDEHVMGRPEFRRGFALLEKYGLSFDLWCFHTQLGDAIDLVGAFPGTTIIVDHVAGPLGMGNFRPETTWPAWEKGIRELGRAASENVYVKLSGLPMPFCGFRFNERDQPPTSEELARVWKPYFDVVLEVFGVRRCMFASNFPVDKLSVDYTVLWNTFKLIVRDYSDADKKALFYENAKRAYRL